MRVPPHVISLYNKTVRRYKKLTSKLQREAISAYERKSLVRQLAKILRRLRELSVQLRIAAATGTVILILSNNSSFAQSNPSALGPFVLQDRINNPLRQPLFTRERPALTAVDFDGDGDLDIVAGEDNYYLGGELRYFENQTAQGTPLFLERTEGDNPFNDIHATTMGAAPAFADIDQDGDLDLFLGQNGWYAYNQTSYRGIEYYRNDAGTFAKQAGAWNEITKAGNPFDGILLGDYVRPVFVDLDKDGDLDVVIGSYVWRGAPYYSAQTIHYYENNGSGTFAETPLALDTNPNIWGTISPALADPDQDGDYDLVIGSYNYDHLFYYRQVTPGNFSRETLPWDPMAKSGNPFEAFVLGESASPVFMDFNGDSEPDLFVADQESLFGFKYSDNIINYYQNSGSGVFVEKDEFENPFDGVYVEKNAAPLVMDLDGDSKPDALVGNEYSFTYYDPNTGSNVTVDSSYLTYYKNTDGALRRVIKPEPNPFDTLNLAGNFVPQLADVDGDGDVDIISGNYDGEVVFFRNDNGIYKLEVAESPFARIAKPFQGAAKVADIDADQDLDLFLSNSGDMFFFRNTGTAQAPAYTEITGTESPLDSARSLTNGTAYVTFADLDHDGDLDLMFNGRDPASARSAAIVYMENTGTAQNPVYEDTDVAIFNEMNATARMNLVDYDGDGDLDVFAGLDDGTVHYLENRNPAVVTALSGTVAQYDADGAPVVLDPDLTLTDSDNDTIVYARVTIEDFQPGELLTFTPQGGIGGAFDTATGVLALTGKATLAAYQSLLRTIAFEVVDSGGRRRPGDKAIVNKSITFAVFDEDFTTPQPAAKSLEIFINDPPTISDQAVNLTAGGSTIIDLKLLISDPNGSADLDLSSLKVTQAPASGAATSIDANGLLQIDYNGVGFLGTETMMVEVCDAAGLCAQNTLTITVTNTPPVITPQPVSTVAGTIASINLAGITSDADGNLDPNAFVIVEPPLSGAGASIQVLSPEEVNLVLDYQNTLFQGSDQVTIRACDQAGACTEGTLVISVTNTPPVITPEPVSTPPGTVKSINLMNITSDADDNLDPDAFTIRQQPLSGAIASIQIVSPAEVNLLLDYQGITFQGTDQLTIQACDRVGACTENVLQVVVNVESEVVVYNAVAPNSSGDNRFMRITGLPAQNKVSIFNRWGDKVYEAENYENSASGNAFSGRNSHGNSLPSGTYFYTVEVPGEQIITGYLTLKQ